MSDFAASILSFDAPTNTTSTATTDAVETTEVDTVDTDVSTEGTETDTESTETGGEESQPDPAAKAGKLNTASVRTALKALREANPNDAKAIQYANDALGRAEAFEKLYPKRVIDGKTVGGFSEAQAVKTAVEAVGGIEGLSNIQSIASSVEQTDTLLAEGNPEVLNRIFEDAPEGAVKLVTPYLAKVAELAPKDFAAAIQPYLVQNLVGAGFSNAIGGLTKALADGNVDGAKEIVNSMLGWFNEQKQIADKSGKGELDPERQKVSEEWKKVQTEKDAIFSGRVKESVDSHILTTFKVGMKPFILNNPNLTEQQRKDIGNSLLNEVGRLLGADKAYIRQMKSLTTGKARDAKKAAEFANAAVTSIKDKVIKTITERYKLSAKKAAPTAKASTTQKTGTTVATGSKPIRVTAKPDRRFWNMEKTTEDMIIRGQCIMNNGKWVAWR